jgi:hypothetical protein
MDFLHFGDVSFLPNASIEHLCEDLNNTVGQWTCYDTFQVHSTKWLWLVNAIEAMNSDKVLRGCFGLCPSWVAWILNSMKDIDFMWCVVKS